MEVIAKKSKQAAHLNIFILVIGIGLMAAGVILLIFFIVTNSFSSDNHTMNFAFILCVIILIGLGLFAIIKPYILMKINNRLSENLIVYDGEKLIFADGYSCIPSKIINVEYKKAVAPSNDSLLPDIEQNYGYLTIYTKDKTITYNQVENVEEAHNKLLFLMK